MKLLEVFDNVSESPFYQDAQRGYETYFGLPQAEAQRDAAQAQAGAMVEVAAQEGKTMRVLAGAGVAVAVAALLVTVLRK
jgi:hypothetical protein